MDFVTRLSKSSDLSGNGYNSILVIVNWLTKIVHYEPVQTTITAYELAEAIHNIVIHYYGLSDAIVSDRGSVFTSKF